MRRLSPEIGPVVRSRQARRTLGSAPVKSADAAQSGDRVPEWFVGGREIDLTYPT